jgi:hypothetical protein
MPHAYPPPEPTEPSLDLGPLSAIEKGRLFSALNCATCKPKRQVCTHGPRPQDVYEAVEKIISDRTTI